MRYQLRYAAGLYWLLDTCQEGMPYKKPLSMNEAGAELWNMMVQGLGKEQIAQRLSQEYGIAAEEARMDVEQFQRQLAGHGICAETESG